MDITNVTPINPFEKPNLELKKEEPKPIILDRHLYDFVNQDAPIGWFEWQRYKLGIYLKIVPFVLLSIKGYKMKDWRTTLSGALGGVAMLLNLFGVTIPPEVLAGILSISLFLIGLFSRDAAAHKEYSANAGTTTSDK